MIKYIFLFLTAFGLSFSLSPLIRYIALKYNIVCLPKEDRWNKRPTAILGGISIFFSFLVSYLLFKPIFNQQILGFLIATSIIFVWGLFDDIKHLNPQTKLIGQIIATCIAVYFGITAKFGNNPLLLTILSVIWIVGITNSINLLDNMDGLASGVAGIAFTFIFISSTLLNNNGIAAFIDFSQVDN